MHFYLNRQKHSLTPPTGQSTLDLLRHHFRLFAVKEGCREGECGACTVLVGRVLRGQVRYRAMPSCMIPAGQLHGSHIVTMEGLNTPKRNPLQQAFVDQGASQCGFCTPGFILSLTAYFMSGSPLNLQGAMDALDGNICRCTGYASIKRAVEGTLKNCNIEDRSLTLEELSATGLIPSYIPETAQQLHALPPDDAQEQPYALPLAGGTDLMVQKGDSLQDTDLQFSIPESREIELRKEGLFLPAECTFEQLRENPLMNQRYPGLKESLGVVASSILRNRATLAGNVVNASPIADGAVLLLAWGAQILLESPTHQLRSLPLEDFFLDYKKLDLKDLEKVVGFSLPDVQSHWHFRKVSKRERLDIASCNSAIVFNLQEGCFQQIRLSFGGVAPVPFTARKTMAFLEGKKAVRESLKEAQEILQQEIHPIDDIRGSAAYKRKLAASLLEDHFQVLLEKEAGTL